MQYEEQHLKEGGRGGWAKQAVALDPEIWGCLPQWNHKLILAGDSYGL